MKANISTISILALGLSFQVYGMGSRSVTKKQPTANISYSKVSSNIAQGIEFNKLKIHDLTKNGRADTVTCNKTGIQIIEGGTNRQVFNWVRPNNVHSQSTQCAFVEIVPGFLSIVESSLLSVNPAKGDRRPSNQIVILNNRGRFFMQEIVLENGSKYKAVGRGVSCAEFPKFLVSKGHKPGALCFFAGYHFSGVTHSALIKLEFVNNRLIAKDLSASAQLPWSRGASGTSMNSFPKYKTCGGSTKTDGYHMMGAAFLDANNDGLPDLITVGQHASVRFSKMLWDSSKREGFRFETSFISKASKNTMTEYLKIEAFHNVDKSINSPCVYISGELKDGCGSSGASVHDHLQCYINGQWRIQSLGGFSSESKPVTIRRVPNRKHSLVIKTLNYWSNKEVFINMNDLAKPTKQTPRDQKR
jgi:hypothetical protein